MCVCVCVCVWNLPIWTLFIYGFFFFFGYVWKNNFIVEEARTQKAPIIIYINFFQAPYKLWLRYLFFNNICAQVRILKGEKL
jgi:hypothetical protein